MNPRRLVKKLSMAQIVADEKGIFLITSLMMVAILGMLSSIIVMAINTDVKISGNYKTYKQTFNIADAGIEHAKSELKTAVFDNVLNGTHSGAPGILSFGTDTAFANGIYSVTVEDDDDGDGDTTDDSNGRVIITSIGTLLTGGSKKSIQIIANKIPFTETPSAFFFPDNDNGETDSDRLVLGSGNAIDPDTDNGTEVGNVVKDVYITGQDTLDGSTNAGDGPMPDRMGIASQEAFRVQGGSQDPAVLAVMGFMGELIYHKSNLPDYDRTVFDGGTSADWGEGGGIDGPTEDDIKEYVAFLSDVDRRDIFVPSSKNKLSQTSLTDFGTSSGPKITYIEGNFEIDADITGYGILIVEGKFGIQASRFEYHGVIFIVCTGQFELNSSTSIVDVWGALLMLNYDEAGCTGASGEERLAVKKGTLHVYFSSDAISKYADGLTFTTDSWRELY